MPRKWITDLLEIDLAGAGAVIDELNKMYGDVETHAYFDPHYMRMRSRAAELVATHVRAVALHHKANPHCAALGRCLKRVRGLPVNTEEKCVLQYASGDLRADQEVVLAAIESDGCALAFASDDLRANFDVAVAAAARGGPDALRFVRPPLRPDDPQIVDAAKAKHVVLTLHARTEGPNTEVSATRMSGEEVARLGCKGDEDMRSLRNRLASEAKLWSFQLRLLLPSGKLLDPFKTDKLKVADCLSQ